MTGPYAILASRIRQDIVALERIVERVERAAQAARGSTGADFAVDSAALNLHLDGCQCFTRRLRGVS